MSVLQVPNDEKELGVSKMKSVETSGQRGGWELHGWQSATQ